MPSNGRLPVDAFKWRPSTAWFKSLDKWSLFGTHYSCPGYITYWSCFTACLTLSPLNAASHHEDLAVNLTVGTSLWVSLWVSVDVLLWVLLYGYSMGTSLWVSFYESISLWVILSILLWVSVGIPQQLLVHIVRSCSLLSSFCFRWSTLFMSLLFGQRTMCSSRFNKNQRTGSRHPPVNSLSDPSISFRFIFSLLSDLLFSPLFSPRCGPLLNRVCWALCLVFHLASYSAL